MSFCGFATFSNSASADAAAGALRAWLAASAASSTVREWTAASTRGFACTFSLVPGTDHFASVVCATGRVLIGDVPSGWSSAPGLESRLNGLAEASSSAAIDRALPETDFSLALWDAPRSRVTLVRCPLGTRAMLYVAQPGEWIAFASLPEALLALPGVKNTIDEAALASQLIWGHAGIAPTGATLFSRLRRLPAGHLLRFGRDGQTVEEYWRLPDGERRAFGVNDPEVPRTLRRLLETAVRRRISGVDRIGTQLSGGLDSSAVTALAHATRDPDARVIVYTVRSHDDHGALISPEEHRLANTLLARLDGVRSHELIHHKAHRPYHLFQKEYLARPLPDMVFRFGPDHRLLAAAHDDGCRVMLTGWGGDQMASARDHLHVPAMLSEGRWALACATLLHTSRSRNVLWALRQDVVGPLWQALRPPTRWTHTSREYLRGVVKGKPLAAFLSAPAPRSDAWSVRRSRRDRVRGASFQVALELQDWLGQRAGVAVHHPLLDRDVIAFCDTMPAEWIACLGVKRRAFRTALDDLLPTAALGREKAPLPRPADHHRRRERNHAHNTRALHDLAASDTWLHRYLNLAYLATAVENAPSYQDGALAPIQLLGAHVIAIARCADST